MTKSQSLVRSGLLLATAAAICFSVKAILVKLAYREGSDATTLVALRMIFSLPFFYLALWMLDRKHSRVRLSRDDRLKILLLGLLGYYGASFLDFMGLQTISVGLNRVIMYLNPAVVLVISVVLFSHRVSRGELGAMGLAYLGVVMVYLHDLSLESDGLAVGTILTFMSTVSYAVYLVLAGRMVQRIGSLRLATYASTAAAGFCLAQAMALSPQALVSQPLSVYGLSLLNATLCTVIPVSLVMVAMHRVGPVLVAQSGAIGPVSTIFLGYWFLGEEISLLGLVGTATVILGIWMLARISATPRAPLEVPPPLP